jgi:phosphoribosylglycinamide formyltransferase-1
LVSGNGTNLQALIDATASGTLDAEICLVVSNKKKALALERARRADIPTTVLPLRDLQDPAARRDLEDRLLRLLDDYRPDVIVLAGWMLILSAAFFDRCPCPIVNVHPALLPMDGAEPLDVPILRGRHVVREALALGLPETGVSVHFATPEVDSGPVILRQRVPIVPGDDEMSLHARLKVAEHQLLPQAIELVFRSITTGGVYASY